MGSDGRRRIDSWHRESFGHVPGAARTNLSQASPSVPPNWIEKDFEREESSRWPSNWLNLALLHGHCCHWSTGLQFVGCTLIGRQTRVVEIMIQGLGHLRPTTESACLLYGTRLHNLTNSFWILFKTAIKWPDYIVWVVGTAAPSRIITIERAPVGRVVMANMKRPVRNGPTITSLQRLELPNVSIYFVLRDTVVGPHGHICVPTAGDKLFMLLL